MKLSTEGQVTIPQEIRERLGLLPYTEVEFEIDGDAVTIRRADRSTRRGRNLIAKMRGAAARTIFYIGAHAAVRGYPLLTRDPRRYRTYFPKLRLIAP